MPRLGPTVLRVACLSLILILLAVSAQWSAHPGTGAMPPPAEPESYLTELSTSSEVGANLLYAGRFGGVTVDVAVQGNYAYLGSGQDLLVIGIADRSHPQLVSRVPFTSGVTDVAVAGQYVYVVDLGYGLTIVNVEDPSHPAVAGTRSLGASDRRHLAVSSSIAYITSSKYRYGWSGNLRVIDIANPAQTQQLGYFGDLADVTGMAVSGPYAYLAAQSGGLKVINVLDPSQPRLEATVPGVVNQVAVAGTRAYITEFFSGPPAGPRMRVINVTDPANPVELGHLGMSRLGGALTVDGNRVYVADSDLLVVGEEYSGGGVNVIDVTDPTHPSLVSTLESPGLGFAQGITHDSGHVYVANEGSGMGIVSVTNPAQPVLVGYLGVPGNPKEAVAVGSYAYVAADHGGLHVLDISDSWKPRPVGVYLSPYQVQAVAVQGNYAYLGSEDSAIMQIVDVSVPSQPRQVSVLNAIGGPRGVAVRWPYVYLAGAGSGYGLGVADVSDPGDPRLVADCALLSAQDLKLQGDYAYVSALGAQAVDISDPLHPTCLPQYGVADSSLGLDVAGRYAYVAAMNDGLMVFDLLDPSRPQKVAATGLLYPGGTCYEVAVQGNYAYVGRGAGAFAVMDISDPLHPTVTRDYRVPGRVQDIKAVGSRLIVSVSYQGLYVYEPEHYIFLFLPLVTR